MSNFNRVKNSPRLFRAVVGSLWPTRYLRWPIWADYIGRYLLNTVQYENKLSKSPNNIKWSANKNKWIWSSQSTTSKNVNNPRYKGCKQRSRVEFGRKLLPPRGVDSIKVVYKVIRLVWLKFTLFTDYFVKLLLNADNTTAWGIRGR